MVSTAPHETASATQAGHKARHRTHLAESLARDGGSDTTHGAQLQENTGAAHQGGNQPRAHTRRERHSSGHVSLQHPREACQPPHGARYNERSPIAGSRGQRRPPQLATAGTGPPGNVGTPQRACTQTMHVREERGDGSKGRRLYHSPVTVATRNCLDQKLHLLAELNYARRCCGCMPERSSSSSSEPIFAGNY